MPVTLASNSTDLPLVISNILQIEAAMTIYLDCDIASLSIIPNDWLDQLNSVIDKHSEFQHLDGKSSTSREEVGFPGTTIRIVNGNNISLYLPWLYDCYRTTLCELTAKASGAKLEVSTDIISAININVIEGIGSQYEWHVDTNPVTGLLFASTQTVDDGGELLFQYPDRLHQVMPVIGRYIAFDARDVPHTVAQLKTNCRRISIPMNYYTPEAPYTRVRPQDLNAYLYKDE